MPKLTEKQNKSRVNNKVQSVLISRNYDRFGSSDPTPDIEDIIDMLGYNIYFVDVDKEYYRVRQFNPGSFRKNPKYMTIRSELLDGVLYVVEY